jgi:hypothetical protein
VVTWREASQVSQVNFEYGSYTRKGTGSEVQKRLQQGVGSSIFHVSYGFNERK